MKGKSYRDLEIYQLPFEDVRVIATTNRNLKEKVRLGEFRENLMFSPFSKGGTKGDFKRLKRYDYPHFISLEKGTILWYQYWQLQLGEKK